MNKLNTEILIVGSGLSGLLVALLLDKIDIQSTIIEKNDINNFLQFNSDGRALAISYDNYQLLIKNNLLENLSTTPNPIEQIRIADEHSPFFLHFDNKIINNKIMGYMIDAHDLKKNLYKHVIKAKNITLKDNQNIKNIIETNDKVIINTEEYEINTDLILAADGKYSYIRDKLNIKPFQKKYNQTAITFNIEHELNHENIALELFLPNGPVAVLPLAGGHKSAIVWIEKSNLINYYMDMSDNDFLAEINNKIDSYLGKITLSGEKFSYELQAIMSNTYYHKNVCFIGDSIHAIHPIAGQGFNLGIRDIQSLVTLIARYKKIGLPLSSSLMLESYKNDRIIDNNAMFAFTDLTDRLFSNNVPIIRNVRKIGLRVANILPNVKKYMMLKAMGDI
jgi:2-octaprenyl-6-methoxyphenol hydroxylase